MISDIFDNLLTKYNDALNLLYEIIKEVMKTDPVKAKEFCEKARKIIDKE